MDTCCHTEISSKNLRIMNIVLDTPFPFETTHFKYTFNLSLVYYIVNPVQNNNQRKKIQKLQGQVQ